MAKVLIVRMILENSNQERKMYHSLNTSSLESRVNGRVAKESPLTQGKREMESYWVANLNIYQEEEKKKWTKASLETYAIKS